MADEVRITVMVDDQAAPPCLAEHGLALWVEADGRRILFDTGAGEALEPNAEALACPLDEADTIVLSHGHYDHGGGLPAALRRSPKARLIHHPDSLTDRWVRGARHPRPVGLPPDARTALREAPGRRPITSPMVDPDGIGFTGAVDDREDWEGPGGPFWFDEALTVLDPVPDDQAMWVPTPRGTVVVTGCAHAGLVGILLTVRRLTGGAPLHAVVGGFHLCDADEDRTRRTAALLAALAPEAVVPLHCTGAPAVSLLERLLGPTVIRAAAGSRLDFPLPSATLVRARD